MEFKGYSSKVKSIKECVKIALGEKGIEFMKDEETFIKTIKSQGVDDKTLLQLRLIYKTSNIRNYVLRKAPLSLEDVNNIILCAQRETGLTKGRIKFLVIDLLDGLGKIPENHKKIPSSYRVKSNKGEKILSASECQEITRNFESVIKRKSEKGFSDLLPYFEECVKAGYPEALYVKGILYKIGIFGIAKSENKAYHYFKRAAEAGYNWAFAELGDYYFKRNFLCDYTNAYKSYVDFGTFSLNERRCENIRTILKSKENNKKIFKYTLVLPAVLIVFNILIGAGLLSADSTSCWSLMNTSNFILCLAAAGAGVYYYNFPHSKIKWIPVLMFIIFALFAIIAL